MNGNRYRGGRMELSEAYRVTKLALNNEIEARKHAENLCQTLGVMPAEDRGNAVPAPRYKIEGSRPPWPKRGYPGNDRRAQQNSEVA